MARTPSRRRPAWAALVAAGALLLPAVAALMLPAVAAADVTTAAVDRLRTSWDPAEPALSPAAVSAADFGRLFSTAVDGQVYAQPLVVDGTVVVATERNHVYGLDPASGAVRWSRDLGPSWPAATTGCGDLAPDVGVTATPVYDPVTRAVYVSAKVDDGPDPEHPHWYLHALSVTDGAERPGWPVTIAGAPDNDPTRPFNPETAMQRPGLLLLDGRVYAGFASHCDYGPYVGYVVGVGTRTARVSGMWSAESGSTDSMAGIWQSGGGLVSDGPGQILLTTGNGVSPAPGPGSRPPRQLAESVVRLSVSSTGGLQPVDFFSPADAPQLDRNDADLGSGAPMALPEAATGSGRRLLVQVGKDGRVFLLDRDDLGGRSQGPGGSDAVVSQSGPYNGVWGSPAYYGGTAGSYVYTVENAGYLRASKLLEGSGRPAGGSAADPSSAPVLSSAGTSTGTFGYTSGSPLVTSSGTDDATALVWVVYADGPTGSGGQLRAYDAVPVGGVLRLRYSAPVGLASKFSRPAADAGRVFVGTRDGHVLGFGRPQAAPLSTQPVDLGAVAVGRTGTATAEVMATRAVTVTAASATAPFAVGRLRRTTLRKGQSLRLQVRLTPTAPGAVTGTLQLSTDLGAVGIDLHGRGTRPGLSATPSSLDFGTVVTGESRSLTVELSNSGTASLTVSGASVPGGAWQVTGVPAAGTVVRAGASFAVSVRWAPTTAGSAARTLTVRSDRGDVSVPLSGVGVTGAPHLLVRPAALAFGSVPVGGTATRTFTLTNDGDTVLTITKAAQPSAPFVVADPLAEGLQLTPGQQVMQRITFTPTAAGAASASYRIGSDDGAGEHVVTLSGTGTRAPP